LGNVEVLINVPALGLLLDILGDARIIEIKEPVIITIAVPAVAV
jgi:hypothetical protein